MKYSRGVSGGDICNLSEAEPALVKSLRKKYGKKQPSSWEARMTAPDIMTYFLGFHDYCMVTAKGIDRAVIQSLP